MSGCDVKLYWCMGALNFSSSRRNFLQNSARLRERSTKISEKSSAPILKCFASESSFTFENDANGVSGFQASLRASIVPYFSLSLARTNFSAYLRVALDMPCKGENVAIMSSSLKHSTVAIDASSSHVLPV